MKILGLNGAIGWDGNIPHMFQSNFMDLWVHGSGATLIVDGELKNSSCEERFSRIKYDGNYPEKTIEKILEYNRITPHDIDVVGFVTNATQMAYYLKMEGYFHEKLKEIFPNAEIVNVDHHLCHASASFFTSGYEESLVISFDGNGDLHEFAGPERYHLHGNNSSYFKGSGKTIESFHNCYLDAGENTFGVFYNFWSWKILEKKLGNLENSSFFREGLPGKLLGLSAYGDYTKVDLPEPFYHDKVDGYPVAKFDLSCKFPGHDLIDRYSPEDLASWVQHKFEEHFIFVLQRLSNKTKNLCLAGGCALNISLNSRIIEEGIFEDVHVNPGPNDDGLSSGVALYLANKYENQITLPVNLGCLGIKYQDEDYEIVLDCAFSKGISFDDFDLNMVVDCLLKNKIIAWFQDGSEFGPRALGNRSILANPTVDNKYYLNEKIKYREYWRPYAPIMLEQYLHDWFDIPKKTSPYMLFNARLKEEKNGLVPAITHVDNTARVQTVNSVQNKKVFDLLTAFYDKTQIPMLLNTSFNIKGEPIVETPMDALNTFIDSDIDYLVIGDNVLWR